jgi:thiosulfate/3-mercaptopyruvate sulfurtransferase
VTVVAPIVDVSWLADHPEAVLADVRWYNDGRSGREAYERDHLPGAVFVDLERHLAAAASREEGRHPLPDPEVFAAGMREAGIGDDDIVIAYDDDSGAICARLVWMLRVTGHQAAMLDGGIMAWRGPREHVPSTRPAATFTAKPWPVDQIAQIDELDDVPVLDARPADRYRGENEMLDRRPGHIPGARSLPARESSDQRGVLLAPAQLRARLTEAGVAPGWVSSCGSGVTACHTLLIAEHLGMPPGKLYVGSWSQWAATDRPATLGENP